ncbi:MAG: hypothetical protein ACLRIS_21290 [Flavonifractor plautii]
MAIETQNGYPSIRITAGERVLRKAAELVPYEGNLRVTAAADGGAAPELVSLAFSGRPGSTGRTGGGRPGRPPGRHGRGMDVVPCILAEGLTAEQRRA